MKEKRKSLQFTGRSFPRFMPNGILRPFLALFFIIVFITGCEKTQNPVSSDSDLLKLSGISKIIPSNLSDSVPLNPMVSVTFNPGTDPLKISASKILLKKGSILVQGSTVVSGTTASFIPLNDLDPNTEYSAAVTRNATGTGTGGGGETGDYSWKFRTGNHHRSFSPSVVSVAPLDHSNSVLLNTFLTITFDRVLTNTMTNSISVLLNQGTIPVNGSLSFSGNTAVFKPSTTLKENTLYYVKVLMRSGDDDYNRINKIFSWSFTTASAGTDVTAPSVINVAPANNATSVALTSSCVITFSEPIDPLTVTNATVLLKQGTNAVAGTVTYSGTTATFTPAVALTANTVYSGTVTTGVKDVAGNAIASTYSWSFTTVGVIDIIPPTVQSVTPGQNATAVPVSTKATVSFSEAMNPSTITSASFTLKQGSTPVNGTVTYSGNIASFSPTVVLTGNTIYTGTITTAAKDIAGNSIAAIYTWSFTTASTADIVAPTVLSVSPAQNATSVAVNSKPAVTFSEAMNPSTITSASFTLMQGTAAVSGTVTYTGNTATFSPTTVLTGNTVYTGTITTAAKDVAGNSITANYSWNFTTVSTADIVAPTVLSVSPAQNATSVTVNSKPAVTFSEAMNPSTITSASFTLMQGTVAVSGTVTYSGNTATFSPTTVLTGSTVYTCTITTAAKDVAGNSITANYAWSFTTVATVTPLSFASDVMPVLNLCNACHTHGWTTSTVASTFYTNLVNSGYVNPAAPTTSKIYVKLGSGHPGSSITTADINKILNWMTQGSANN